MKCLKKKHPVILSGLILPWFKGRINKAVLIQKIKTVANSGGSGSAVLRAMAGKAGSGRAVAHMGRHQPGRGWVKSLGGWGADRRSRPICMKAQKKYLPVNTLENLTGN